MNLDLFVNFKIKVDYRCENDEIFEEKILDYSEKELLSIDFYFIIKYINTFLSELKFFKFY